MSRHIFCTALLFILLISCVSQNWTKRERKLVEYFFYTYFIDRLFHNRCKPIGCCRETKRCKLFTACWTHEQPINCAVSPVIKNRVMALLPNGDDNLKARFLEIKACVNFHFVTSQRGIDHCAFHLYLLML